jgi:hypothetical protein
MPRNLNGASNSTASSELYKTIEPVNDAETDVGKPTKRMKTGYFQSLYVDDIYVSNDLYIGNMNILTAITALQNAVPPPEPTFVRFPITPFTDDFKVFASVVPDPDHASWKAYDNVYGTNSTIGNAVLGGWVSSQTSSLQVDGTPTTGAYNYFDVGATAIIKRFQIYSAELWFPVSYHIIGSNDQIDWASLYYTAQAEKKETYLHGAYSGAYTYEIPLPNTTHYKYIGILIVSSAHSQWKGVQELLFWGNEEVVEPPTVELVQFPKVSFTAADNTKVFASTEFDLRYLKWQAYDGFYGKNVIGESSDSRFKGWVSTQTSSLQVDNIPTIGSYNYFNIGSTATIASFQIYSPDVWFPVSYHIIGSNNQTDWTSLYYTAQSEQKEIYEHGTQPGAYTYELSLPNTTHYKYIGILIISSKHAHYRGLQELLFWGTE